MDKFTVFFLQFDWMFEDSKRSFFECSTENLILFNFIYKKWKRIREQMSNFEDTAFLLLSTAEMLQWNPQFAFRLIIVFSVVLKPSLAFTIVKKVTTL